VKPRIALCGDQPLYGTEAGIDQVVPAPVLHDAIGVVASFLFVFVFVLPVGQQAKQGKRAKCRQHQIKCGKRFSHDRSPIDSGRRPANGLLLAQLYQAARRLFSSTLGQDSLNVITIWAMGVLTSRLKAGAGKLGQHSHPPRRMAVLQNPSAP
jgi:hypothetical protein